MDTSTLWPLDATKVVAHQLLEVLSINYMSQDTAVSRAVWRLDSSQLQRLLPKPHPLGYAAEALLSCKLGQYHKHQHRHQAITHPTSMSSIFQLTQPCVQTHPPPYPVHDR